MSFVSTNAGPIALALLLGQALAACNATPGADDVAPAPIDSSMQTGNMDTSAATPPITPPSPASRDTPPATKPDKPAGQAQKTGGLKVSQVEYEGWRQYSVNCARCHGQDVLPNPVAANLLISLGRGGPIDTPEKFVEVVTEGRPERGMPAFKGTMSPEQIGAAYAYVKGRAEKRIPPGRPTNSQS